MHPAARKLAILARAKRRRLQAAKATMSFSFSSSASSFYFLFAPHRAFIRGMRAPLTRSSWSSARRLTRPPRNPTTVASS